MQTTIRLVSTYKKADSLILLLDDKGSFPKNIFSAAESEYISKELKADKKTIIINKYDRLIALYLPEYKKDEARQLEQCRRAGDALAGALNRQKLEQAVVVDLAEKPELALAIAEGMALGNYQFLKYRKEKKKETNTLKNILIKSKGISNARVQSVQNVVEAVYQARTLVNEPQSWLNATQLSNEFARLGREAGFKVSILNKAKIKALNMGGLLAVNLGSRQPPTFTIMEWKPARAKNKQPIVLVGKGVVYDTGGLSLKPTPNSMDYMKSDMAGGAAVACTMYAIAKSKLPVHVIALVPATDNRLAEDAYTPGDVITMMSGHTVEVLNTDAEGRLILADALHFAKRYKPELVLDFATLTGAAAMAVGPFGIVYMGTADEKIKEDLKKSGERVYERLAEFPFWDEYDELIKSDIADMKNIGGPIGGAITAGKFLQRYVDYPWLHFDIAGPSFLHTSASYRGKGGSGVAVRMLYDFLEKQSK
jgi:leucyl aminopeptidase